MGHVAQCMAGPPYLITLSLPLYLWSVLFENLHLLAAGYIYSYVARGNKLIVTPLINVIGSSNYA